MFSRRRTVVALLSLLAGAALVAGFDSRESEPVVIGEYPAKPAVSLAGVPELVVPR